MQIEYSRGDTKWFRFRRLFLILSAAGILSVLAVAAFHLLRAGVARHSALAQQEACLHFDGGGRVVYAATRRLLPVPQYMALGEWPIATDLSETVAEAHPACWARLLDGFQNVDVYFATVRVLGGNGICFALHERSVGGEHFLLLLEFDQRDSRLRAYLVKTASYWNDPVILECAVVCDIGTQEFFDRLVENHWESLVLHSAVMDSSDPAHFTFEALVDSQVVTCDGRLTVDPATKGYRLLVSGKP